MNQPFPLDATQIAQLCRVPVQNVITHWPTILACMNELQVASINSVIAALATIAVETNWKFAPIKEMDSKDGSYLKSKPYYPYFGRGFGQITWEENYKKYGDLIGVNLIADPDAALEPNTSALLFAAQWHDKKCDIYADAERWRDVRVKWNGGTNGLPEYLGVVGRLMEVVRRGTVSPP